MAGKSQNRPKCKKVNKYISQKGEKIREIDLRLLSFSDQEFSQNFPANYVYESCTKILTKLQI